MDISQIIEQVFKMEPGSGLIQSVLLLLIWINIRSLKKTLEKLEENHDTRIEKLEETTHKLEGRVMVLESPNRGNA